MNAVDDEDQQPLHYAVKRRQRRSASLLLERDANVNARDQQGRTPLQLASACNDSAMLRLLIRHGAEEDEKVSELSTEALAHAVTADNAQNARVLDDGSVASRELIITTAAQMSSGEIISQLLTDEELKRPMAKEMTVLHWLVNPLKKKRPGEVILLQHVLSRGADPNARNADGWTPLHGALVSYDYSSACAAHGMETAERTSIRLELVRELVNNREVNLLAADSKGRLPLLYAIMFARNVQADKLLIETRTHHNTARFGRTLLHYACIGRHTSTIEYLLSLNVDVTERDDDGDTVLHYLMEDPIEFLNSTMPGKDNNAPLSKNQYHQAVKVQIDSLDMLLKNDQVKTLVNSLNNDHLTPLLTAIISWNNENPVTVMRLLANGANVSTTDNDGNTPLHLALQRHYHRLVYSLLLFNAPLDVKNSNGETPLMIAERHRNSNCSEANCTECTSVVKGAEIERSRIDDTLNRIGELDSTEMAKCIREKNFTEERYLDSGAMGQVHKASWHLPNLDEKEYAPKV